MISFLFWFFVLGLLYLLFSRPVISSIPKKKRLRKPVASLTEDDCKYNVKCLYAPRATGLKLKLLVKFLYTRFGRNVVYPYLMKQSGLELFDGVSLPERPTYAPLVTCKPTGVGKEASSNEEEIDKLMKLDAKRSDDHAKPVTVADYIQGYQLHKFTPLEVIYNSSCDALHTVTRDTCILFCLSATNFAIPSLWDQLEYNDTYTIQGINYINFAILLTVLC